MDLALGPLAATAPAPGKSSDLSFALSFQAVKLIGHIRNPGNCENRSDHEVLISHQPQAHDQRDKRQAGLESDTL